MGEKEGVLEFLTKQLVKIYEEEEKENLEKENLQLKETIKTLQHEKENLEKENFQLKETNTRNSIGEYVVPPVTNDTPEKDVEKVIADDDEGIDNTPSQPEDVPEKAETVSEDVEGIDNT